MLLLASGGVLPDPSKIWEYICTGNSPWVRSQTHCDGRFLVENSCNFTARFSTPITQNLPKFVSGMRQGSGLVASGLQSFRLSASDQKYNYRYGVLWWLDLHFGKGQRQRHKDSALWHFKERFRPVVRFLNNLACCKAWNFESFDDKDDNRKD